jgi:hypothetical protein
VWRLFRRSPLNRIDASAMKDRPAIRTPEEEECILKQAELATLEDKLADVELELATLKADLKTFDDQYRKIVAPCYAEMEQLQADAAAMPKESTTGEDSSCPSSPRQAPCPPGELKTLFREVARSIHPDLASSEEQRRRRDELMAHANAAYANGDDTQLRELLLKWQADPHAIVGDDVVAQLIRAIRLIAWVKNRTTQVKHELRDLRKTDLYFLRQRAERAAHEGRDLLQEVRANLERQIVEQRKRVST